MRSVRPTVRSAALAAATTAAVAISTLTLAYLTRRALSRYGGIRGTLRLLWEGDHLTPEVRASVDALDELEGTKIPAEERRVEKLEVEVDRALLDTVDGGYYVTNATMAEAYPATGSVAGGPSKHTDDSRTGKGTSIDRGNSDVLILFPHLRKEISTLSYRLDGLAADVDSVRAHGDGEVRARKKKVSSAVVVLMERTDGLMERCGSGGAGYE